MASPLDFGWWIESTDEEKYGPVTKATLDRFLADGTVSPNTLVRHCTAPDFLPIADHAELDFSAINPARRTGDTLSESWPRRRNDQLELAASDIECAYHRRPAILTCIRCLGPYCSKCQLSKKRDRAFICKKCNSSLYNRRTVAILADSFLNNILSTGSTVVAMTTLAPETAGIVANLIAVGLTGGFLVRDPLFGGAGPGKRMMGLSVVKQVDGNRKITFGQALIRNASLMIPFFNLVDINRAYRDPAQQRYGDRWAKTRVTDTEAKLEKAREKTREKLERKGIELTGQPFLTMEEFVRLG